MNDAPKGGFPVVLTADRTLMADYRLLLDGMVSCSQTTTTPGFLVRLLIAPPLNGAGVRAPRSPLGLRRVEAALLAGGFAPEDVAIVTPEKIGAAVGPRTRLIGVSSGDPLGIGMNSSTMAGLAGGESLPGASFRRLMAAVRSARGDARVVLGGPGAWQLLHDEGARRSLGIDLVVSGYCEAEVAGLFGRLLDERGAVEPVFECGEVSAEAIPRVLGPVVMGVVEISRGCGMGCGFCTLARRPMVHLAAEAVAADVDTNLAGGVRDAALTSEDFFRYGATGGAAAAPGKLLELLRRLREMSGLRLIQADHASIRSVAAFSDEALAETRRLMAGRPGELSVWVNLGVETASGELLAASGGSAKMSPWGPSGWADACREQVLRLSRAGFLPMVSLVVGLPGESAPDVLRTIEWVESLPKDAPATVFPVFHVPVDGETGAHRFGRADMTALHWRLFESSYRLNFRRIPRLYARSHAAAGTGLLRRAVMGLLGRGETLRWRARFWSARKRAP